MMRPALSGYSLIALCACATVLLSAGCQTDSQQQILAMPQGRTQFRQMQSRVFQTADRQACFRAVLTTLRGMGYDIDKADDEMDLITATSVQNERRHFTVTIAAAGAGRTRIRANGERYLGPMTDPAVYQALFDKLGTTLSLQAYAAD